MQATNFDETTFNFLYFFIASKLLPFIFHFESIKRQFL